MAKNNREILTQGKGYAQRKSKKHSVEEVTFDKEKRYQYLTGFHKRKVQRQKKAQEYIKEQERLARIEERKQLRDERKRNLENQLTEFNAKVKEIAAISGNFVDSEVEDEEEEEEKRKGESSEGGESVEWSGFDEEEEKEKEDEEEEEEEEEIAEGDDGSKSKPLKGILLRHTEVYEPIINGVKFDDETTTVTIEPIDNTYMNNGNLEAIAKANNVNLAKSDQVLEKSIKRSKNYAVLCGVSKPSSKQDKKPKKKFRYLSKAERRENNRKEKIKGKLRGKK
ncbi:hypothetical protein KGF56_001450 [Candida oxycetoniae]|uniref:Ribosomal RNA-processing protein 17 n=1 Tax=Candida oxycetoniae TaxID=497107 RepID=A0AAI9WZ58_9ASCO|nr:uncharacterized protein KGF56_001450 [Candida oxycetoniae]KAI3405843.2 hypothetical protein KGF56_001450 [Candida oxycetoniae]